MEQTRKLLWELTLAIALGVSAPAAKITLSLLITMLVCSSAFAGDGKVQKSHRPIPDRYLVQFEDFVESPEKEAKEIAQQYGGKLRHVYKHGIKGFAIEVSPEQAAEISRDSRVEHVEEDGRVTVLQVAPVSPPGWGLDRINQAMLPLDHSAVTGCNSAPGVIAYILDTGVNPNATEFGTRLTNGFTVDGSDFSDEYGTSGHGTGVASIIGGATYGVARSVSLINVKVVAPNLEGESEAIAGIDWILGHHQSTPTVPKVVNMSLGYPPSLMLDNKVIAAIQSGIPFVVGAGNSGIDACDQYSPARLGQPNNPPYNSSSVSTITVSGTRLANNYSQDQRASSANHGPCVDIFAPSSGVDMLSSQGQRKTASGTSYASPYVAGAVARHLRTYIGTTPFPSPASIESTLKSLATQGVIYNVGLSPNLLLYVFNARCRSVGP